MNTLPENPTKQQVLKLIADASIYGNLGAFIGAGFSMAVMNNDGKKIALSWLELLKETAKRLDVKFEDIANIGMSCPEIALAICSAHSIKHTKDHSDSVKIFKYEIASLTLLLPEKDVRKIFSDNLRLLNPSWIVTTNYDSIIETLLPDTAESLSPEDIFISRKSIIPVMHLHGVRTDPDNLIITQEDYLSFFRPSYRQTKLALSIKESVTVLLGYSIGDTNIQSALDWALNVYEAKCDKIPTGIIQVLRKNDPKPNPYYNKNNKIHFIEFAEIGDFFAEFEVERIKSLEDNDLKIKTLKSFNDFMKALDEGYVKKFINEPDFRKQLLAGFTKHTTNTIANFEIYLEHSLKKAWEEASKNGNFDAYAPLLSLILDVVVAFNKITIPPVLLITIAKQLDEVSWYFGDDLNVNTYYNGKNRGKSHLATKVWFERKIELNTKNCNDLKTIAQQYGFMNLKKHLETI
jgi:SIR2-like domain